MRLVICLIVVCGLSGCDYIEQHFDTRIPIILKIDTDWVVQNKLEFLGNEIQTFLDDRKIRYLSLNRQDSNILITYEHDPKINLTTILKQEFPEFSFTNVDVLLEPENRQIIVGLPNETRLELIEFARHYNADVVLRLLDEQGIHAKTRIVDIDRFEVSIPKSTYSEQLVATLLFNESLAFHLVAKNNQQNTFMIKDSNGNTLFLQRPGVITGEAIINAEASFDNMNNQPAIMIALDSAGANIMEKTTRDNIGRQMAVLLIENTMGENRKPIQQHARVISVATIQGEFGRRFMITGLENMKQAEELAAHIRAGEFAAPMKLVVEPKGTQQSNKGRGEIN